LFDQSNSNFVFGNGAEDYPITLHLTGVELERATRRLSDDGSLTISRVSAGNIYSIALRDTSRAERYRNLEIRLVSETGGGNFPLWKETGELALNPEVLFTGKDFADIEASHGGDDNKTPSLALHFTPEASAKFTEVTTRFSGRRLAVVVDGKVVTAPKILHPIITGLFEITGSSESDVREMYGRIAGDAR
jgi:preprotein translocase subunit SecD